MLVNVSWKEYLVVLAVTLVVYYVFVGIRYYRKELDSLLKGELPKFNKLVKKEDDNSTRNPADFEELEAVVDDLRYAIFEKAGKLTGQQELAEQLNKRLQNYSGLQKPAYRVAINNYIIRNAKEICGVVFSESELDGMWDTPPR
jgi:hypothetical protein